MITTEKESNYNNIDQMSLNQILVSINNEDKTVAHAVEKVIPQIEKLAQLIIEKINLGGRLFYIGSGTSGRLGIVDAAECPPTFGVDDTVFGIIAGGDNAIRKAVEHAEDQFDGGWEDLLKLDLSENDIVVGISASGTAPYVLGALQKCSQYGIATGVITNNENTPIAKEAAISVEVITGPEFITGSTRMKAGTSTKLILNMISTSVMVKLGKIKGNKMVDMKLVNNKLIQRGTKIVMDTLSLNHDDAQALLRKKGSVRNALESND